MIVIVDGPLIVPPCSEHAAARHGRSALVRKPVPRVARSIAAPSSAAVRLFARFQQPDLEEQVYRCPTELHGTKQRGSSATSASYRFCSHML